MYNTNLAQRRYGRTENRGKKYTKIDAEQFLFHLGEQGYTCKETPSGKGGGWICTKGAVSYTFQKCFNEYGIFYMVMIQKDRYRR